MRSRSPTWSAICRSGSSATGSRRSSRSDRGGRAQPANWKVIVDNYLEGYHIPIAHPGLMRMLDYKRYGVELHENYVWFEAPMRAKPSSNRLERLYGQLVEPMPGLTEDDLRVWRYVFIYPNTTIDLYPDQVNTWHLLPDTVEKTTDVWAATGPAAEPETRAVQWLNGRLNNLVLDEDIDLVDNVQQGLKTRGYLRGPLSRREDAVAWFADKVRADLAPALARRAVTPTPSSRQRRARADPARRRSGESRARGSTRSGSRGSRWMPASRARSCITTSTPVKRFSRRRSTTRTSTPAMRASRAASSWRRPMPSVFSR